MEKNIEKGLKLFLIVILSIITNAIVGKYIWNNVLVKIISGIKKVNMTQIILLHILLNILICRC